MSQLIVEKVAEAIRSGMLNPEFQEYKDLGKSGKAMYDRGAKAAIGALRDLPDSTFETMTQKLEFMRVIDNIGKDIAIGK